MRKLLLLMLLPCAAFAQGQRFDSIAWNQAGNPQPGVTVSVCKQPAITSTTPCSPLATLYTDTTLTVSVNQNTSPVISDSLGNFHFYYNPSDTPFTLQFSGAGVTTTVQPDQLHNAGASTKQFWVTDFGNGVGTGSSVTDTNAYNAAVLACQVSGGVVYFPPGSYNLSNPNALNLTPPSATQVCSLKGASASSTQLTITGQGITLSNQLISQPYHAGEVSGLNFSCSGVGAGNYCLRVFDSVGWHIHDNGFSNQSQTPGVIAILFEINAKWCEDNLVEANDFWLFSPILEAKFDSLTTGDFAYNIMFPNHYNAGNTDVFFSTGTSGGGVVGNILGGSTNFAPTTGNNANWFHITGSGNKIGPGNYFNFRDENDGLGTRSDFCIDPGVTIASGTSLSGFIMAGSGGMIGCTGTQAVNTNLDVWGRGFYAGQNGLYWGDTLTSATGAPSPIGRITGGTSNPGACDNGVGADPAGSIFTNNSITSSGANSSTIWGCIGQNYQPFVLRQGAVDLTGQTNNIGTMTVTTATASGQFLMTFYEVVTTRDAVSATLPAPTFAWTDADNSAVQQVAPTVQCTPSASGDTTATTCIASLPINAKTGTNIQFFTSGYASNTPNFMTYAAHVRLLPF